MPLQTHELTAPSAWASYLINGDASGMEPEECAACDAWIDREGLGFPVDCEDAGFRWQHDASKEMPLGADCQTYFFLTDAGDTEPEPIPAGLVCLIAALLVGELCIWRALL